LNDDRRSFNSFTFTDISSAFFEQAKEAFAPHVDRMDFRPLDIRRDPSVQDFPLHSYDLIIASNVLHATPKLDETLRNVRSLLKPGGQLIVIEVAHREHTRIGYIFGLFPDWWAGHDEGRILEPFISYDKWDTVLKSSGFSGVDSRTLDPDSRVFPNGVFSSHAVDDFVARLDDPLTATPKESYAPLVLVGGASQKTAEMSERLANIIPHRETIKATSIPEIIDLDLQPGTSFIVLAELDKPTFAALDDEILDALQTLFNAAQHVLWVTESAWTEDPVQAMSIGLLRTLRMEYPDVEVQVLDLDTTENLEVTLLAETLSRLEDGGSWEEKGLLWTQEPELYLQKGKIIIPRLKFDKEKNHRLNSNRRPILVDANPADNCLEYTYDEDKPTFRLLEERFVPSQEEESPSDIEVYYSLPYAVQIQEGESRYIVLGKTSSSGAETTVVALTQSNASRVRVPSSQLIAVDETYLTTQSRFFSIVAELTAKSLLSGVSRGMRVLVFHPPSLFVQTLARRATNRGITIYFASSEAAAATKEDHWIHFHENDTQRSLRQKLPKNISLMFDFTAKSGPTGLSKRIAKYLPTACTARHINDIFQETATSYSIHDGSDLSKILGDAVKAAEQHNNVHDVSLLSSHELLSLEVAPPMEAVIDWRAAEFISSRVRSMEIDRLFVDDKTYLLVGLAGDLGRSIARYMVERGARYIVLSSRSPKIDQRWIDELATIGGEITALPM
jgi:SAM-dependent methyltransferase